MDVPTLRRQMFYVLNRLEYDVNGTIANAGTCAWSVPQKNVASLIDVCCQN